MSKSEVEGLVRIYMDVLTGFEPEAYAIAASMILLERKNSFRLMPAEIREYLEKAEQEHYNNGGQVRKAKVLKYHLRCLLQYGGSGWNRATWGPPPGEPGCRLHEDAIAKLLRAYLTYEYYAVGDWPDDMKTSSKEIPHLKHRRCKRVQEVLGIDMLAHPTYRAIVVELGIPHTAEVVAAADAEITAYHAKREDEAKALEARHKAALEEQEAVAAAEASKRRRRDMESLRVQREATEARWAEIARRDRQTTTR